MKSITAPEPVTAGETVLTFADFVRHTLLVDQRFNSNGAGIRSAAMIETALVGFNPDGSLTIRGHGKELAEIKLEEADYDRLLEAVESPLPMQNMPPYPLRPARLCAPFLAAIKAAG